jgi:hypothetical protein
MHDELLEQAAALAKKGHGRPKQVDLRRSVSAAYYALFHLIVATGCERFLPGGSGSLRPLLARAFDHKALDVAAGRWIEGRPPPHWAGHLSRQQLDPDLVQVARDLRALQQARHKADYDIAEVHSRSQVLGHLQAARRAFAAWRRVRNSTQATLFLMDALKLAGRG